MKLGKNLPPNLVSKETIPSSSLQGRLRHSALPLEAGFGIVRMTCVCETLLHLALLLARLYVYKCRKLNSPYTDTAVLAGTIVSVEDPSSSFITVFRLYD